MPKINWIESLLSGEVTEQETRHPNSEIVFLYKLNNCNPRNNNCTTAVFAIYKHIFNPHVHHGERKAKALDRKPLLTQVSHGLSNSAPSGRLQSSATSSITRWPQAHCSLLQMTLLLLWQPSPPKIYIFCLIPRFLVYSLLPSCLSLLLLNRGKKKNHRMWKTS